MFKKIIKDILTGIDGKTFDFGRVAGLLGVLGFLLYTGIDVLETHTFEYEQFGIGFGTLMAGIGVLTKLKQDTEPKNNV